MVHYFGQGTHHFVEFELPISEGGAATDPNDVLLVSALQYGFLICQMVLLFQ